MIIVSKDKTSFVNVENVVSVYVAANDMSIKANVANGNLNVMKMGSYQTQTEAERAFQILLHDMETKDICYLPSDEQVKAAIANDEHGVYRHRRAVRHMETEKKPSFLLQDVPEVYGSPHEDGNLLGAFTEGDGLERSFTLEKDKNNELVLVINLRDGIIAIGRKC